MERSWEEIEKNRNDKKEKEFEKEWERIEKNRIEKNRRDK